MNNILLFLENTFFYIINSLCSLFYLSDKRIFTLSSEKPATAVLKMGVPLIAGMFIMVLYNLVDTYFIGLMKDDYRLAAVNLAYPVMMITVAVSNIIGTGASSLIARSLGAGDMRL